ncbi:hypothetical protein [Methylophaga sulfidovorans]|uniref:PEP-CTERM protein-sorting domain-containing protein n=1 Tax=Methylophaga sulfidovorans TaxID=45496 RepID=A0A1I3XLQ1_9GAMM|nr:hypothetical protein [Methylophaga sulfidovorans]SFK20547.1 hypothetical protein SAMN04488079_106146 [Methylophaga sulfidovorans]
MKKAMLFVVALMFSVSVSAATLTLDGFSSFNASQEVSVSSGSTVLGGGYVTEGPGTWNSLFNLSSNEDTYAKIEWSFNPESNFTNAQLGFTAEGDYPVYTTLLNIMGDYSFVVFLEAGVEYAVDIINASRNVFKYDVSVSAVPVPAAVFLFAPALLGFLGLRRKSAVAA